MGQKLSKMAKWLIFLDFCKEDAFAPVAPPWICHCILPAMNKKFMEENASLLTPLT